MDGPGRLLRHVPRGPERRPQDEDRGVFRAVEAVLEGGGLRLTHGPHANRLFLRFGPWAPAPHTWLPNITAALSHGLHGVSDCGVGETALSPWVLGKGRRRGRLRAVESPARGEGVRPGRGRSPVRERCRSLDLIGLSTCRSVDGNRAGGVRARAYVASVGPGLDQARSDRAGGADPGGSRSGCGRVGRCPDRHRWPAVP